MASQYTEFRKSIGKSLQAIRKASGFKSAKEFANHFGINVNTYTDYEQGRGSFSYERAWELADALHCTLDELGGRDFQPPGEHFTPAEEQLVSEFRELNAEGQQVAVNLVGDMQRSYPKKADPPVPLPHALGA